MLEGIMEFNRDEHAHTRYNPLKGEWVLVSPHRTKRPWCGQVEDGPDEGIPEFDPKNPLCPGVMRHIGQVNPNYKSTFTFTNDYPALLEDVPSPPPSSDPLFQMESAQGTCRVMCFHPKSNITLPLMTVSEIRDIIDKWIEELTELGKKYIWVQIFENKGAIMGCSNPHPHCQIWASGFFPNEPRIKEHYQLEYYKKFKRPLLMDYVSKELEKKERIVTENVDWVVVVPYWAVWPYETMLLPKTHLKRFSDLKSKQRDSLASIIKCVSGAPTGPKLYEDVSHWVFHGVYYPPLLRSATIKKFMVGYEMLAQCQRDLTQEQAAEKLRNVPDIHYKQENE
ncbi:probable galactose-1-phosphate uridylyltransferase [Zootermopsis nevadensis]|uniref:probable galactose-1-phosphate uridylyltransferase n=1 Tax=Zootermopsis nevadensis TaxID=136037 RepID=UPI000B8EE03B|nr:probable galactose-1-phosphate uridylyltransferase [Zootermopsis nevadensis]